MFQRFMSPSRGSLSVGFENIIKLDLPNCKLTESNLPATLPGTLPNLESESSMGAFAWVFASAFCRWGRLLGCLLVL